MKVQVGGLARCQRVSADGQVTWTVIDGTARVVEPVEEFLEFGGQSDSSANTIRSYATALALWVRHLDARGRDWDSIDVREPGRFADAVRLGALGQLATPAQAKAVTRASVGHGARRRSTHARSASGSRASAWRPGSARW